ncbi:MAG: AAA family ATPase [Patescibacteria group bacterium]|nr:AAA family ATPase [Patescibacteria group bacterium]
MKKQVILMRGIPGSGKSFWIKKYQKDIKSSSNENIVVCSADDYQEYQYQLTNPRLCHDMCLRKFIGFISSNAETNLYDTLIVDNTNIQAWEIAPYYRLAELAREKWDGLSIKIVHIHCDYETAMKRNIHRAPAETVWKMYQGLLTESLPSHWNEEIVFSNSINIEECPF